MIHPVFELPTTSSIRIYALFALPRRHAEAKAYFWVVFVLFITNNVVDMVALSLLSIGGWE